MRHKQLFTVVAANLFQSLVIRTRIDFHYESIHRETNNSRAFIIHRDYGIIRHCSSPDSKVHGAHMGPTWGQDPGGPCWPHKPCYQGVLKLSIRVSDTSCFVDDILCIVYGVIWFLLIPQNKKNWYWCPSFSPLLFIFHFCVQTQLSSLFTG